MEKGDRLEFGDLDGVGEVIKGVIESIERDEHGTPTFLVVKADDGQVYDIELESCEDVSDLYPTRH